MTKQQFFLVSESVKANAIRAIQAIAANDSSPLVVEIRPKKRTLDQNAAMWAMLADVAEQVEWHGHWLTKEEWKDVMTAALTRQKAVPGIDGGFVVLGARTRKMTKPEMADLLELISAFGSQHGVQWTAPEQDGPRRKRG